MATKLLKDKQPQKFVNSAHRHFQFRTTITKHRRPEEKPQVQEEALLPTMIYPWNTAVSSLFLFGI